jgi:hypothetical protein
VGSMPHAMAAPAPRGPPFATSPSHQPPSSVGTTSRQHMTTGGAAPTRPAWWACCGLHARTRSVRRCPRPPTSPRHCRSLPLFYPSSGGEHQLSGCGAGGSAAAAAALRALPPRGRHGTRVAHLRAGRRRRAHVYRLRAHLKPPLCGGLHAQLLIPAACQCQTACTPAGALDPARCSRHLLP